MWESSQFGEQSLSLLREQANKLKTQSKDIELKDEQVRFLKQTILALQQEKDVLAHHNHQLKLKLKTMAAQITNYNSQVVQQVYRQNQELIETTDQLTSRSQQLVQQNSSLNAKVEELQSILATQNREKTEQDREVSQLKDNSMKLDKKIGFLEKENKELQHKNIVLQRQLDDSTTQITYCSQQIDILTQKHHEALKTNEKKIKQTMEKMISKEQYQTLERDLKEMTHRCKELKEEGERVGKEKRKIVLELTCLKEKKISQEIKEGSQAFQIKVDLTNLLQSIKLGKKVIEFQSSEHQIIESIYDLYLQIKKQEQQLNLDLQMCKLQLKEKQSTLIASNQALKMANIEVESLTEQKMAERECLESHYEGKLMQISVRLRREEIALAQLRGKETALDILQEQFDQEVADRETEKQTLSNTIDQLRKENGNVANQLKQALQFCQGNIVSWQGISHYKERVQELVAVVHYLHSQLLNARLFRKHVLNPFVERSLKIVSKKKTSLGRLRKCVWVLVALHRMKTESQGKNGIERHVLNALLRRNKIETLGVQMQKMSQWIVQGMKTSEIIVKCKGIYTWRSIQYPDIVLDCKHF